MKMIIFDTETTGLRPGSICQLSYILIDTTVKPTKTVGKNLFFTVDYVEPSAESIHGFSTDILNKLSSGKDFNDRLEEFTSDFKTADIFIGHNVNFDIKFLTHELKMCGQGFNPTHTFCTMNYYKNICKLKNGNSNLKAPKLQEAINFLNIEESHIEALSKELFGETGNFHDARYDATATYLLVTQGIKKGFIPPKYFSNIVTNK